MKQIETPTVMVVSWWIGGRRGRDGKTHRRDPVVEGITRCGLTIPDPAQAREATVDRLLAEIPEGLCQMCFPRGLRT